MNLNEIQNRINQITSSSILSRIFYWKKIMMVMGELKTMFETMFSTNEDISKQKKSLETELAEVKIEYKSEKKIKEKTEGDNEILKNKIDLLLPLKEKNTELTNELNKMKQEENAKDLKRDSTVTKYEQFENNAREREEEKKQKEEAIRVEEKELLKRTWQDHEENVNKHIKLICQEESIKFIDEWGHDKKPDNVIMICGEYIVFDAKSPRNDELNNFPTYIKTQANSLSKYAKHKDVKKHLFLVVPENTTRV